MNIPTDPGALLDHKQVCDLLGLSNVTLRRWRLSGEGPAFIRIAHNVVKYRRCDIDAWVQARRKTSTAA